MSACISQRTPSNAYIGVQITSEACFVGAGCALIKFFEAYSNYIFYNPSPSSGPITASTDSPLVQDGYAVILPLAVAALAASAGLYMKNYTQELALRNR